MPILRSNNGCISAAFAYMILSEIRVSLPRWCPSRNPAAAPIEKVIGKRDMAVKFQSSCAPGGLVIMRRNDPAIDCQESGEQRRPGRAQEEACKADVAKPHRRQVQFDDRLGVAPRADFANLEAGETFFLAVAFDLAVIDIVVAERTEEEIAERALLLAGCRRGRGVDPQRRVAPRQRHAIIEAAADLGIEIAQALHRARRRPECARLFHDRPTPASASCWCI